MKALYNTEAVIKILYVDNSTKYCENISKKEVKKQATEVVKIKSTSELLIHLNKIKTPETIGNTYSIDDFPSFENKQEEHSFNKACRSVNGIKF
ncbi:hypothetical protein [Bartonella sp. CB60]|uniref:hypothetical protein n=1 Tax=Bartonella sp. CB60 TaxID=3113619 RepID=UPI003FA57788